MNAAMPISLAIMAAVIAFIYLISRTPPHSTRPFIFGRQRGDGQPWAARLLLALLGVPQHRDDRKDGYPGTALVSPLGSWPAYDEFQVGITLVWVRYGTRLSRRETLRRTRERFPAIWADVPRVIASAEAAARAAMPAFWDAHDAAGTAADLLEVWGIDIDEEERTAHYDVNFANVHYPAARAGMPERPDGVTCSVRRDAAGGLRPKLSCGGSEAQAAAPFVPRPPAAGR
jgi:hypothetical protein